MQKQGLDVKVYAQDPAFTPVDISFLSSLDIQVKDPGIQSHISTRTFVYSPFVDWYLLLPTFLQTRDPELYIGNEILDDYTAYAQTEDKRNKLDECNQLGRRFLDSRDVARLEDFELHAHALNGLVVYWKKQQEDNDEAELKTEDDAPS